MGASEPSSHSPPALPSPSPAPPHPELAAFSLPIIYDPSKTGFEATKDYVPPSGPVIAGRYLVQEILGTAAFSTAYRCLDLESGSTGSPEVALKIVKNSKDFFDQSLDEIKILKIINDAGDCDSHRCLKMIEYFYYKEHLIIVTELLKLNLYEFQSFINSSGERRPRTLTNI